MYTQHLYTFHYKDNPTFYLTKLIANAICKTNLFFSTNPNNTRIFHNFFFSLLIYIKKKYL